MQTILFSTSTDQLHMLCSQVKNTQDVASKIESMMHKVRTYLPVTTVSFSLYCKVLQLGTHPLHSVSKEMQHEFISFPCDPG